MIGPIGIAALFKIFAWWISTGLILLVVRMADRRGKDTHLTLTVVAPGIFLGGLWGFHETLDLLAPYGN